MLTKKDLTSIAKIIDDRVPKIINERVPLLVKPIIAKALEPIKKDIRKIQRDLEQTSKTLDREILADRKRIEKLEEESKLHQSFHQ